MKRPFVATVWKEGNWYVSQCLEMDVASQGETEEALSNLKEALELHFEPPRATRPPALRTVDVEVGTAHITPEEWERLSEQIQPPSNRSASEGPMDEIARLTSKNS